MTDNAAKAPPRTTAVQVAGVALAVAAGLFLPPGVNWITALAGLAVFLAALGLQVCGRPAGVLINERAIMSLARFQIVLWTTIIVSAYATIALSRVRAAIQDPGAGIMPLDIRLDWHLWALLGISGTSLVGSSLIQSNKQTKQPADTAQAAGAAASFKESAVDVVDRADGILYRNPSIKDARFSDLFEGDEIKNAAVVDISKVQMFFFTIVAAITYSGAIFQLLITTAPQDVTEFPTLSDGLIAILGISHGTYLGSKHIDKTKTT
jgi:hypothetical protein